MNNDGMPVNNSVGLLETPWRRKLLEHVREVQTELIVCAPYFSENVVTQILDNCRCRAKVKFILGFSEESLKGGQSELSALLKIVDSYPGVEAKHIENLHAKVYIFDGQKAIVTSSNPTVKGLEKNIEFGVCLTGEYAAALRAKVMAYWADPDALLLDSAWLREHKHLLEDVAKSSKRGKTSVRESHIGKNITPKGTDIEGEQVWAILWSTHEGIHIKEHQDCINKKGATLWGTDFGIIKNWYSFPVNGYLYVTLRNVELRATIVDIETYHTRHKPREIELRPVRYREEYHKTYLKLKELESIQPVKVTDFVKHDGRNVSKYGVQRYVRISDPAAS